MLKPSHLCCMMGFASIGRGESLACLEILPHPGDLVAFGHATAPAA